MKIIHAHVEENLDMNSFNAMKQELKAVERSIKPFLAKIGRHYAQ